MKDWVISSKHRYGDVERKVRERNRFQILGSREAENVKGERKRRTHTPFKERRKDEKGPFF